MKKHAGSEIIFLFVSTGARFVPLLGRPFLLISIPVGFGFANRGGRNFDFSGENFKFSSYVKHFVAVFLIAKKLSTLDEHFHMYSFKHSSIQVKP